MLRQYDTICPGDKKRAFTTQGILNTSLIIESCTLSIFSWQHNRIGIGVSSLANKLHLASKNLQNKHLITVGTGFGNTRAPKTHHTMRNSRRLARYKAHGFFLATRRHWDALTKHAGRINYKKRNGMDLRKQKNVLLLRIGLNTIITREKLNKKKSNVKSTVNSLVSDHPWCTTKWSLTGGGRLPGKIKKRTHIELINVIT